MTRSRMPVLFVGHGSPMNAIEENDYTQGWKEIAGRLPKPEAILSVSAHWYTRGTRVNDQEQPRMVYDMYGFPEALYKVRYDAAGAPDVAKKALELLGSEGRIDNSWGIDHGTWSVLCRMFPDADIPVFQLSVDGGAPPEKHFALGQALGVLREEGVLILGSGNVVHNLSLVDWDMDGGFSWAEDFDDYVRRHILDRRFGDVLDYRSAGTSARQAFSTPDHFYPLLYVLGAARPEDGITVFNNACTLGALSMTSYLFG